MASSPLPHAVESNTLGDILERILDKGIVIAGDIRVTLVGVELLTLQLRLVIASVDKAKEMGIDWWSGNPYLSSSAASSNPKEIESLRKRVEALEKQEGVS